MIKDSLAIFLLRLGLGGVFFWFGVDKCLAPESWAGWVPVFIQDRLPMSMNLFLTGQGVGEAILGLFLVIGFLTRFSSFLCALILAAIVYFSGFNEVMVRDLGLLAMAVAILVAGPKALSLDYCFRRTRSADAPKIRL